MKAEDSLYLVDATALPEVYIKVVKAKKLLKSGQAATVNEAVSKAGISRSVFYKYKDHISAFNESGFGRVYTINAMLRDQPGVLQSFLSVFAGAGCNVLTINQNIPQDEIAPVSVSISADGMRITLERLLKKLSGVNGVIEVYFISNK